LVDFILTADFHLTETVPVHRKDDYIGATLRKLKFLTDLKNKHNCPILCSGDVFHYWKSSPMLISFAIKNLPNMFSVAGNHDLPEHSLQLYPKSSLHVLELVEKVVFLNDVPINVGGFTVAGFSYGQELHTTGSDIVVLHEMVFQSPPWPNAVGYRPRDLVELFGSAKLILTGHNHGAFVEKVGDVWVVNPGALMRMSIDSKDYKPRCYLYSSKDNTVKEVFYPIDEDVFEDAVVSSVVKDDQLKAFIEQIDFSWQGGLSFKDNLERFFKEHNTPRKVREVIWRSLETTN